MDPLLSHLCFHIDEASCFVCRRYSLLPFATAAAAAVFGALFLSSILLLLVLLPLLLLLLLLLLLPAPTECGSITPTWCRRTTTTTTPSGSGGRCLRPRTL